MVDVFVYDFVDLAAQFVGDFCFAGFHELAHHTHDVLAALGSCVGDVEIVERHVLHDLLLLVDVAFGDGYVFLGLEIELGCKGVAATDSLDGARIGFNVDDIADADAFLLDGFVD